MREYHSQADAGLHLWWRRIGYIFMGIGLGTRRPDGLLLSTFWSTHAVRAPAVLLRRAAERRQRPPPLASRTCGAAPIGDIRRDRLITVGSLSMIRHPAVRRLRLQAVFCQASLTHQPDGGDTLLTIRPVHGAQLAVLHPGPAVHLDAAGPGG